MKIHRWLDFKVTRRCDNAHRKCDYCDVAIDPPDAPELMPLEIVHRTLLDARRLGFDHFWLLGGEASLRDDAARLFEPLATDPDIHLTVVTNAKKAAGALNWVVGEMEDRYKLLAKAAAIP